MKYFYLFFLTGLLFPLFSSAQNVNADTTKDQPRIKIPVHYFVGVELNSFSSSISSSNDELNNAKASKSITPGLSLGVNIPFDENNRWIFDPEVSVASVKNYFNYQYSSGAVTQINETLSFKDFIVSIAPQIKLNIVKTNNLDVYISSGVAVNLQSYSSKQYKVTLTYTVSGTTSTSDVPIPELKSITFCVPVKAGVVVAKYLDIFVAYNAKTSLNNDSQFSINQTLFSAGLHYIFGR